MRLSYGCGPLNTGDSHLSRCHRVHGACGALALRPPSREALRRDRAV